jgi:hypothetical protein
MASKNPPAQPAKPQIYAGQPQGTPTPAGLDRLEEANEALRFMAEQHNQAAAHASAQHVAGQAQMRVQQFRRAGFPELELPEPTGEKYRRSPVYQSADGRHWIQASVFAPRSGSVDGPLPRRTEAVSYVDFEVDGLQFTDAVEWFQLTKEELEKMRTVADKNTAEAAEIEQARTQFRKLLSEAITHHVALNHEQWFGMHTPTLDKVEEMIGKTGAEVEIRRGEVFYVRAASEADLRALAGKLKNPPRFLDAQIRGHSERVQSLLGLLEALKPLSVEWVKNGKRRPKSDTEPHLPANKLAPVGGAWLP